MLQSNVILSSLSKSDLAALQPHLKAIHLAQKAVLYEAGDTTKTVYFPTSAVISLVVTLSSGETTEAAMVGRDGAIGIASALDSKIAFSTAVVQLEGEAIICDPAAFRGPRCSPKRSSRPSCGTSRLFLHKRNNPPPVWQTMTSRPGYAAGYCAPATCLEVTSFPLRRNFWRRCSACAGRA